MGKIQCQLASMDMLKNNAFCSICTVNYSAYAGTLNDSLIKVGYDSTPHYVLIVDYDIKYREIIDNFKFQPIYLKDIQVPNIDKLIEKYSAFELSNVLKPFFMEWILKNNNNIKNLIYLDTDIYVYKPLDEIFGYLDENKNISVALTPHLKEYKIFSKIKDYSIETLFMKAGLYNGGFYALKNNENSFQFLEWHKKELFSYGYNAPNAYMFVDQKILDFAPVLFNYVGVYNNKTYNVGHWNFFENPFFYKNGVYYIGEEKLTFLHFSYLKIDEKEENKSMLFNILLKSEPILQKMCYDYWECLNNNGYKNIIKINYKYENLYIPPQISFIDPILHKDKELEYLNKEIQIKNEEIKNLNQGIHKKNEEIKIILNSMAWRLTFPLRKLFGFIKLIKQHIK